MKNVFVSTVFVCLAGCGGGGGSAPTTAGVPATSPQAQSPAVTERLASYIGTWSSDCLNHELETASIVRTPGTTDSINISLKTEYFSAANCSGSLLATETDTGVFTAKYVATVNSAIVFAPNASAVPANVDQVTASRTQSRKSVIGSGVVHTVKNGQAQWCIDFGGGNSTCVWDMGTEPAQSGATGALFIQGSDLYVLSPSGSVYAVDSKFKRK